MNQREIDAGLAPTPGYRYAELVGDQLFIAGQVPLDAEGNLVGKDSPREQARACLDNLARLLGVHGFAIGDVRRLTVHVVGDHDALAQAWEVVTESFDGSVPPATLLGAHLLGHQNQLVEIDATVIRSS